MKYYVVSEQELKYMRTLAHYQGFGAADAKEVDEAADACRARPVPEWATHFAREPQHDENHFTVVGEKWEEIKK